MGRLRRSMRAVVFLWVRGHAGVYCNAYADTIAKASLDERVEGGQVEQRATLVRYETREGRAGLGGATEWAATSRDRRPLAMTEREVQKWLTVKWRTLKEEEAGGEGKVGELLIDDAVLAGQKGLWWTQLLRRSSAGGRRTGSRGAASDVGAVMMVRGGLRRTWWRRWWKVRGCGGWRG